MSAYVPQTYSENLDRLDGNAAAQRTALSINNVDNTSDADKPISSATQTALDAKAASSHVHGNITSTGAIGSTANLPLITTASGVITVGSFGTTANTFCQGNDSRLSDARTPTAHNHSASEITSGELSKARQHAQTAYLDAAASFSSVVSLPGSMWHNGGGNQRTYYAPNSTSYHKGHGSLIHAWYDSNDISKMLLTSDGNLTTIGTVTSSGSRPVTLNGASGFVVHVGDSGGWAQGSSFAGPNGTSLAEIGIVGTNNSVSYGYIGPSASPWLKITSGGFLELPSSNRIFQDSGNLYIESDGGINLRDYSSGVSLWGLANDGRTFAKINVWHSDSDGNPRIVYNGSGGATNFNGAYNFVSSDRGHGFYNDGTIKWGSNAVSGNSRGALSWNTDVAIITSPLNMDLTCGGAMGLTAPSGFTFIGPSLFYGAITSIGNTNGTHSLVNRNENVGSSAYSRLALVAYGNSWGIGMGSSTNNSNALEIREDALGANTLRFKMDIGGAAAFSSTAKLGDYTVATLPSASAYTGYECNTTDSSVTTFGSTVAGGGSSNVKVRSNGTDWTVTGI